MKNKVKKEIFIQTLEHMELYNELSPFPVFDTEVVKLLRDTIKEDFIDYDDEPVECCKHCKNLFLMDDEDGNTYCLKCRNSVNETEVFPDIFEYLKLYGKIWGGVNEQEDEQETS